ncbi:Six-hairpin glycosidase-like protein [Radiomyces spectabilis]|uniref:Six-hairpin glycosidase-like protein n=1 Tax=Radiomyces spectabilis TaxID=64574 RepID=UPI00221E49C1|nr:Six-hairpin glycosidase-like protein [Radiomyces spectabilis]KAI8381538.1 Six-hairpin glycosidase-like protein [Radiomyces spectabilis]
MLNHSLWFYEAQRSGYLPKTNRVPWRSNSSIHDGEDNNVDLVGGYYDAGNYMKFTVPLAHTISLIAWSASEWFDGYQKANQTSHLYDMVRWGTDWLMKAHPKPDVLYLQVGAGNIDNNYWGPDTGIPRSRPSYMVNATAPGTDAAGLTAAALAASSFLFRTRFNDTAYANTLLEKAISVYNFALSASPWQIASKGAPATSEFYSSNTYDNQLIYGTLWLYRATGNTTYRDRASHYFDVFNVSRVPNVVMDWSNHAGSLYVLGATIDNTTTKYRDAARRYLDNIIDRHLQPCSYTDGGLLWCDRQSVSNSLIPAQNMALLALLHSKIDDLRSKIYTDFAISQINYVLGANRMLTPYVVGIHPNSPRNPHHAGASGGTDLRRIDTEPPEMKHTLYGAMVGGPDQNDLFYDIRSDYKQTEVAIDYNAPFQGLIAYQLSTGAGDPPFVSITEPRPYVERPDGSSNPNYQPSQGLKGWLIAVIVILALFIVSSIALLTRYCLKRNRHYTK